MAWTEVNTVFLHWLQYIRRPFLGTCQCWRHMLVYELPTATLVFYCWRSLQFCAVAGIARFEVLSDRALGSGILIMWKHMNLDNEWYLTGAVHGGRLQQLPCDALLAQPECMPQAVFSYTQQSFELKNISCRREYAAQNFGTSTAGWICVQQQERTGAWFGDKHHNWPGWVTVAAT